MRQDESCPCHVKEDQVEGGVGGGVGEEAKEQSWESQDPVHDVDGDRKVLRVLKCNDSVTGSQYLVSPCMLSQAHLI